MRLTRLCIPLFALLMTAQADARPLDSTETETLDKALKVYFQAISGADADGIVAALPPRILNVFAGATGIETSKLRAVLAEQTRTLIKGTSFRDVTADETALDAEDSALSNGTRITWVLIPTAFVSETKGKATHNEQPLLAVHEMGKWNFLRIDNRERRDLAAIAYPFLKDEKFPEAKLRGIE